MSTLAKLVRLQPRSSLFSFRLQASRTLSLAAPKLYRPSLTRAVPSSWSPVSMRYFSTTEPEENDTNLREKLPPSRSLFIANIPWTAVDNDIRELFSSYGTIQRVYLYPDPRGGHRGCGRIDFEKLDDAITAHESGQVEPFFLMERSLVVDFAKRPNLTPKSSRLYFRDFTGNEEDLRLVLGEHQDSIIRISFLAPLKYGQLWDRGHILFREGDTAEEVLDKFNGKMTAMGCRLHLEYARAR